MLCRRCASSLLARSSASSIKSITALPAISMHITASTSKAAASASSSSVASFHTFKSVCSAASSSDSNSSSKQSHSHPRAPTLPPSYYSLPPLTPKVRELLNGFSQLVPINVAWSDQDAFRHVNNAMYIKWCETARIHWLIQLAKTPMDERGGQNEQALLVAEATKYLSGAGVGPILKSVYHNYLSAVKYPDCVIVGTRIHSLTSDRFSLTHRLVSLSQERVVGEAEGIIVSFSYEKQEKAPIPYHVNRAIVFRMEEQENEDRKNPMQKPPRQITNFAPLIEAPTKR